MYTMFCLISFHQKKCLYNTLQYIIVSPLIAASFIAGLYSIVWIYNNCWFISWLKDIGLFWYIYHFKTYQSFKAQFNFFYKIVFIIILAAA